MSINVGQNAIDSVYYGNDEIIEIYKGSDLLYSSEPWYKSDLSGNTISVCDNAVLSNPTTYYGYEINASDMLWTIIDGQLYYNKNNNLVNSGRNWIYSTSNNYLSATNSSLYGVRTESLGNIRLTGSFLKDGFHFYNLKGLIANNEKLYYVTLSGGANPTINSSTEIASFTNIMLSDISNHITCMIDGDLYKIDTTIEPWDLVLIDSNDWTDVCGIFGIKNSKLYYINTTNNTVILKDGDDIYSKKIVYFRGNYYMVTDSGILVFGSNHGIITKNPNNFLKGRWDSVMLQSSGYNVNYYPLGIRNGALYYLNPSAGCTLIDDTRYYTKCSGTNSFGIAVANGLRILDE